MSNFFLSPNGIKRLKSRKRGLGSDNVQGFEVLCDCIVKKPQKTKHQQKNLPQFLKEMKSCFFDRCEDGSILYFRDLVLRFLRHEENFNVE